MGSWSNPDLPSVCSDLNPNYCPQIFWSDLNLFPIRFVTGKACWNWKSVKMVFEHTEKSFRNLIKWTRIQIVYTIFRLIWNQTDVRLVPNRSDNDNYNLVSNWFNKILKRFLCVLYLHHFRVQWLSDTTKRRYFVFVDRYTYRHRSVKRYWFGYSKLPYLCMVKSGTVSQILS